MHPAPPQRMRYHVLQTPARALPTWAPVTSAAAIALAAGLAIGHTYAGTMIQPHTIVLDTNTCPE